MERKRRLGYAIRRAREQRGMSPPELASRIGVARGTVNEWESGGSVPSMLYLGPLCDALMVDPRLFADLPQEPPSPVDDYLIELQDRTVQAAQDAVREETERQPRRPRARKRSDEGSAE